MPHKKREDRLEYQKLFAREARVLKGAAILARRRELYAKNGYGKRQRYGITPEEVFLLWVNQLCACPICGKDIPDANRAHLDHDHATGRIRGLLHNACNRGVGYLQDSAENCTRAAAYLQRSGTTDMLPTGHSPRVSV